MILLEQNEKRREPGRKMSRKDAEAFRGARMGSLVDMVKGISRDCGHRPFLWLVVYDFEDHWRDERG
jgi:hypothetical protein